MCDCRGCGGGDFFFKMVLARGVLLASCVFFMMCSPLPRCVDVLFHEICLCNCCEWGSLLMALVFDWGALVASGVLFLTCSPSPTRLSLGGYILLVDGLRLRWLVLC